MGIFKMVFGTLKTEYRQEKKFVGDFRQALGKQVYICNMGSLGFTVLQGLKNIPNPAIFGFTPHREGAGARNKDFQAYRPQGENNWEFKGNNNGQNVRYSLRSAYGVLGATELG